jgi:transcriptional regulator with GAF, ATPase, and Fis domain
MRPWSLTTALAAVEPDIWSTTPFAAVGFVVPAENGLVRFEMRTAQVATANLLRHSNLPRTFRVLSESQGVAPSLLDSDLDGAIGCALPSARLGSVIGSPLGSGRPSAIMWAALADDRPIEEGEIRALARFAIRVDALAAAGEPPDVRERRLVRYNALRGVLSTLASALDVRDVFGRLSMLARKILPHDSAVAAMFEGDGGTVSLHALSAPAGSTLPAVIPSPYPNALHRGWEFALHHDLASNPKEREWPMAHLGMRSAMSLPLDLNERVVGMLTFSAFAPHFYSQADVIVARRVADYITLALSHQRLADEAREAAAVRERAAQLDMLDGLLRTLAGVLDVRDVFTGVSQVSERVIAHDAMAVSVPSDDKERLTTSVATGGLRHLATPFDQPVPAPRLLNATWDYELVDDLVNHPEFKCTAAAEAGMVSMLSLPVWLEGRLSASVDFFSRTKGRFTRDDVLVGRRIADRVALAISHQRLAEEQRRAVELAARAANLELLDQLLMAITDAAEVSEMFERISAVAGKVLAHDGLCLVVMLAEGERAIRYVNAGYDAGRPSAIVPVIEIFKTPDIDHEIVDDLAQSNAPHDVIPFGFGFRSALRVPIWLDGRLAADLSFLSRSPATYTPRDVLIARRIADRIALCLRRERGLKAAVRADEAVARAAQLERRVRALTEELDERTGYRRVIGRSAPWKRVLTQATQVAATETTVLLLGESGTGKEVIARFLHRASARAHARFVALNCAALPDQLLEAELFGYERGAFTGATQSKPGQLEQAAGGTLFLDEVGELSPSAQAKFLRVLQEREFQRLGGTRVLKSDARIVAATNRDLRQAMAQGRFREDLFYRLNVFAISLPALRDRTDDVQPLAEAFLAEYSRSLVRPPAGISRDARDRLRAYHWPGNVRELRNSLERAAILCDGGLITAEHLSLDHTPRQKAVPTATIDRGVLASSHDVPQPAAPPSPAGNLESVERALIEQALQNARFNKSKAANELGITRAQLYARMKKYGLD